MSLIDERLRALGIVLPKVIPPVAKGYVPAFAPYVQSGDQIHLSGLLGKRSGSLLCGKIGSELTLEDGKAAARETAIELLTVLQSAVGDLGRVRKIVMLHVMVNCAPDFTEPHSVANGASELLTAVFGEQGLHARSSFGVAQLPFGACVELELIAEVSQAAIRGQAAR